MVLVTFFLYGKLTDKNPHLKNSKLLFHPEIVSERDLWLRVRNNNVCLETGRYGNDGIAYHQEGATQEDLEHLLSLCPNAVVINPDHERKMVEGDVLIAPLALHEYLLYTALYSHM